MFIRVMAYYHGECHFEILEAKMYLFENIYFTEVLYIFLIRAISNIPCHYVVRRYLRYHCGSVRIRFYTMINIDIDIYNYFLSVIFVLLEDQGLPEEVLRHKKEKKELSENCGRFTGSMGSIKYI